MSFTKAANLKQISKVKTAIQNDPMIVQFIGASLAGDEFKRLTWLLGKHLYARTSVDTVAASVPDLLGVAITEDRIANTAWRLAGNRERIADGFAIGPWTQQMASEWMPLQIVDIEPRRDGKGNAGADFSFRILAGSAAGLVARKFWTNKYCRYISKRMGFTSPRKEHPFTSPLEYFGMRVYGLFESELSNGAPGFKDLKFPSAFTKHNRLILKIRARDGFNCPKDYKHPCFKCHIGKDVCPAAVHQRTYVQKLCNECSKMAYFDPEHTSLGICIQCQTARALKR